MGLDTSIPTLATLGDKLAEIHRETRRAVNTNTSIALRGTLPLMKNESMASGANTIDAAGNISFNITLVTGANDLDNLPNGYDGQFVILRVAETEVGFLTVKDATAWINLQENLDFIMQAGDVLILLNQGGVIGTSTVVGQNGKWFEIHRQLYNAVLGLIDSNGVRYRLFVDNFGALSVVTPI